MFLHFSDHENSLQHLVNSMFVELMSAVPNGAVGDTRSFGLEVKEITSGANIIRTEIMETS